MPNHEKPSPQDIATQPSSGTEARSDVPAPNASKRPRRRRRLWLRIGVVLVVVLTLLVAFAPLLLSTGPGNRLVFSLATRAAGLEFEGASFAVGWLGGQRFEADRVWHKGGAFDVRKLRMDANDLAAWKLITGGNVGEIPVAVDSLVIRPDMFPPAQEQEDPRPPGEAIPADLAAVVTFTADELRVESLDQPPLFARDVSGSVELARGRNVTLTLDAQAQRGEEPPGEIFADVTVRHAFDEEGQIRMGQAEIEGTVEVSDLSLLSLEDALGLGRVVTPVVGDRVQVARFTARGAADLFDATLTLATPRIEETALELRRQDDTITVNSASPLRMELLPEALAALLGDDFSESPLTAASSLTVELDSLRLPFDAQGQLRVNDVAIAASGSLASTGVRVDADRVVELSDTSFSLTSEALHESIDAGLNGIAAIGDANEPFAVSVKLQQPLSAQPTGSVYARLPVALAEAALGGRWPLTDTLGSNLETTLVLSPDDGEGKDAQERVAFTFTGSSGVSSARFTGWADVAGASPELRVQTPETIRWPVTPETVAKWNHALAANRYGESSTTPRAEPAVTQAEPTEPAEPFLTLARPTRIELSVPGANARFNRSPTGLRLDAAGSSFRLVAGVPSLELRDPAVKDEAESRAIVAEELRIEGTSESLTESIAFRLWATIPERVADAKRYEEAGEDITPGRIEGELTVRDALGPDGSLRIERSTMGVHATAERVATSVIDDLAKAKRNLSALLGPVTSASLKGVYRLDEVSRFDVSVRTSNVTHDVPIALQPDFTITAFGDITAEVRPTPMTFREVLGEAMPMVADAIGSTRPITIRIDGDSLRIPMEGGLDFARATVKGEFDLGTLRMRRDGWVGQTVFGVINNVLSKAGIKLPGRESRNTIDARFTPVRFSLADGIATTEQFWLYGDDLAIGFQDSRINIDTDKIEKLSMGILGASFIAGSGGKLGPFIKAEQIYTLPVGGRISSPNIDTNWLTIELTGSIVSRTLDKPTLGIGGKLFDVFGNRVRDLKTKPMQLKWDPPEPVIDFLNKVKGEAPEEIPEELKEQDAVTGNAQGQAQEDSSAQPEGDTDPRDVVRDVLGGVLRDVAERQRDKAKQDQEE